MDTLTHIALGACIGEIQAGKKLGKKAMLLGAIANNIPDIDVISYLWLDETGGLLAHRGFTHSILFCFFFSLFTAFTFKRFELGKILSLTQWWLFFGTQFFSHIVVDALTVYGTGWFEPFHTIRISFNTFFIIDPIFSIPLLISFIALWLLKKGNIRRKAWAKVGITISSLYLVWSIGVKIYVNKQIEKNIALQAISVSNYMATPTPFNNLLWYIILKNKENYYITYYSILEGNTLFIFDTIPQNNFLLSNQRETPEVKNLIRFSKGYYNLSKQDSTIVFSDMRFGQVASSYGKDDPFVFYFNLQKDSAMEMTLNRGRWESINQESLVKLLKRIKGKQDSKQPLP